MANFALVNSFLKRFGPTFPQPPLESICEIEKVVWEIIIDSTCGQTKESSAQTRWLKLPNEYLKSESGMAESEHANSAIVENSVGCHMN